MSFRGSEEFLVADLRTDPANLQSHGNALTAAVLFLISFIFLFLGMTRTPNIYDEGLVLTGALRILAGQIPHRDFYAIYGPAEYYVYAGLFKLFTPSLLASRLLDLCFEASTISVAYLLVARYCENSIAIITSLVTMLWLYSAEVTYGYATVPVSLLCLISAALILPAFTRDLPARRLVGVGALAGIATLYRYDMGIALTVILSTVLAIAYCFRKSEKRRARRYAMSLLAYLMGLVVITLPPAIYFLSRSPLYPLVNDIVILQSRNYHRGRNLPFPGIHLHSLEDLGVYIPLGAVLVAACALFVYRSRTLKERIDSPDMNRDAAWQGYLITLSLLALVIYLKGTVRVSLIGMYPSLIPSILVIAMLFHKRNYFPRWLNTSILMLVSVSSLLTLIAARKETKTLLAQRSVVGRILRVTLFRHRSDPGIQQTWCKLENPVTKGFCFLLDEGRVETIEYLDSHMQPGQTLFVGLSHHDKVFANDNIIYFATQHLPATHWSHFDPGLQNSSAIQSRMIQEFELRRPPYMVLDSQWNTMNEPNASSKSTGVYMLDDYIHSHYRKIESYDEMTIWQRLP